MTDPTRTTTALLDGLVDPANAAVWDEFDRRYRPIIVGFGMRLGLSDADAADVAQDVLARFLGEYRDGRYDRARGRLRNWLISMVRSRAATLRRSRAAHRAMRGDSAMDHAEQERDEAAPDAAWEEERRRHVLRLALDELAAGTRTDPKTIRAFELLFVHGLAPAVVAAEMEMSVHDVYMAKSRVAQRLRAIVDRFEASYVGED